MVTFDQHLFLVLNSLHSPFFDGVMTVISFPATWVPLYLALIYVLIKRYGRKMIAMAVVITLMITASDRVTVLLKNSVKRPRPCYEKVLEGKVHIIDGKCGGAYGFVSSHASNSFAVALLSLLLIRKKWFSVSMIIWALFVGYSRIYLGVHYPGDVIAGSMIGAAIGWAAFVVYELTDRRYMQKSLFFNALKKET